MWQILKYCTASGREPFQDWFCQLDWKTQAKIDAYIIRTTKNATRRNIRSLGDGIFEIKIDFGPGYRVYYAEIDKKMILLLLGGSKKTQRRDIAKAKTYWRDYFE